MIEIPILSRLRLVDYQRILITLAILVFERLFRICLFFFPYSLADWLRFHAIGIAPRLFKGWQDDEIADLKKPMVQQHTAKEMVEASGDYECEEHLVFSPDGHILVLHRLKIRINTLNSNDYSESADSISQPGRLDLTRPPPVLFMHGAMMTSEAWLVHNGNSPNSALPYVLLQNGYDVWLANRRGNKYSSKHRYLKPSQPEFWDFSLDETAIHDIPAVVDYILEETGYANLSYIGFSQGTAEGFAALSVVRSLNTKINLLIAMAPTTKPKASGFNASLVQSLIRSTPELVFLFFGRKIMLNSVPFWQRVLSPRAYVQLLDFFMKWLFDWKLVNIREEDKVVFYQHLYSFTSVKQMVHWFQIIRNGKFQMYDEGPSVIGQGHIPPQYPLHQITTPIAIFEGGMDTLRDSALKTLPSVVAKYTISSYEHLDFLWAESVDRRVWPVVVKLLGRLRSSKHPSTVAKHSKQSVTQNGVHSPELSTN